MTLIGRLYRPTIGIFGCTDPVELSEEEVAAGRILTGEMSPDEAALAVDMLGVHVAIAAHYLTPNEDTDAFTGYVRASGATDAPDALAPALGETITVENRDGRIVVAGRLAAPE